MTVNYSFDLENDDFLDDTFRSIPEKDLLSHSILSPVPENQIINKEFNKFQDPGSSDAIGNSTVNTDRSEKRTSFLFENREIVSAKEKDLDCSEIYSPNNSINTNESTKINSRFVPGFTPKAKKRKLPGPAGFFSKNDDQHFQPIDSEHLNTKDTTAGIEIQNITNSQFSSEDLLLPSWQNLQAEVSSCHNLLSTAKYYSIRRVLHETSKKKLPKHLVVPVLCVLIKKFNAEKSSHVFMDDTGEISGKIDKEVFDAYKDVIHERTALILKKVTCICNILILKKQNVVSIYHEDGSVKHVQDLNSILDKEEPLKPMNCQCPGTPEEQAIKKPSLFKLCSSTPITTKKTLNLSHKIGKKVVSTSLSNTKSSKEQSCNVKNTNTSPCPQVPIEKEKVLNILEAMLDVSKSDCSPGKSMSMSLPNQATTEKIMKSVTNATLNCSAPCSKEIMKSNLVSKSLSTGEIFNNSKSRLKTATVSSPSFVKSTWEEDIFSEEADDFDDILCSLDEKSFHQEM